MTNLAWLYHENGQGVAKDYAKAMAWYRKRRRRRGGRGHGRAIGSLYEAAGSRPGLRPGDAVVSQGC